MRQILLVLILSVTGLASIQTYAQGLGDIDQSIKDNPEALVLNATSLERKRKGYGKWPVVQCPGVQAKYIEFLGKLKDIKEKIKTEACPKAEKEKIEAEVDNISNLVGGTQRTEFTEIMKKGLAKDGEISKEDADKVRSYVESIVKTTAVVTGLTKNKACFDEEDQNLTFATLSSIISEASGALGAVSGPMGAKITLGGKIAAGLVDSVGAITKARNTYCKKGTLGAVTGQSCTYDAPSEQAYVSTLCAYYQFKFDIDEVTNPENRMIELGYLIRETNNQLEVLKRCDECFDIITNFTDIIEGTEDPNEEDITFTVETTSGTADSGQTSIRTFTKPLYEYSYEELLDIYQNEIRQSAPRYSVDKNRQLPTYYTIRSLRTKAWAEFELERVALETDEHDPDVALGQVRVEQNRIEEFLFEDEAPKFINFAAERAKKSVTPFIETVIKGYHKIRRLEPKVRLVQDERFNYVDMKPEKRPNNKIVGVTIRPKEESSHTPSENKLMDRAVEYIHDIFRHDIEFLDSVTSSITQRELDRKTQKIESYLESFRFAVLADLKAVKRQYAIFRDYCRLFEYGKLRYHGPVGDACIKGHESQLTSLKRLFEKLDSTLLGQYSRQFQEILGKRIGTILQDVNTPDRKYTRDWVSSLTQLVIEQTKEAKFINLKDLQEEEVEAEETKQKEFTSKDSDVEETEVPLTNPWDNLNY